MLVKKDRWHYEMVKKKKFVKNLKPGNNEALNYIASVWLAIFCSYLVFPLATSMLLILLPNVQLYLTRHPWPLLLFFIIVSSPLWFTILLITIEPFLSEKWKELSVYD